MPVRFYLHNSVRNGRHTIMCSYTHKGKVWRFSTELVCKQANWDDKKKKVKSSHPQYKQFNTALERIENRIEGITLDLKIQGDAPTPEAVKAIYREGKKGPITFWEAVEKFKAERLPKLGKVTAKHYGTTFNQLAEFQEIFGEIKWDKLTKSFHPKFVEFLEDCGDMKNTIASKTKDLKAFLNWCRKMEVYEISVQDKWKSGFKQRVFPVLSIEEMERIQAKAYSRPVLQRIADVFLFECETGLRFKSLANLNEFSLREDVLMFNDTKGKKLWKIKLSDRAREIWDLYGGNLPVITNQKYNQYLKEVCKEAEIGIGEMVEHRGDVVEKWQAITTHTARRTFITRFANAGAPIAQVSKLVGHASVATTMRYYQASMDDLFKLVDDYL